MEAMAAGAIRVLNGEEELKEYMGKLVWDDFGRDGQLNYGWKQSNGYSCKDK